MRNWGQEILTTCLSSSRIPCPFEKGLHLRRQLGLRLRLSAAIPDALSPVFTTDPAVWVQIIGQRGKLSLKISGLRCFRAQRPQVMFLWTAESGDLDCA